jgi:hypothetical protein
MGGLFSAPRPVTASTTTPAASANAAADEAAAARDARLAALERARRGLGGTIATSDRGVLKPRPGTATRKSLLGE